MSVKSLDTPPAGGKSPLPFSKLVETEGIARDLKAGQRLTITQKDGTVEAVKSGADFYQQLKSAAVDAAVGIAHVGAEGVNTSFGVDPTLSALGSIQATYDAVSGMSLVPSTVTSTFSNYFFPAFRLLAPILDSIKLANTIKLSKAGGNAKAQDVKDRHWWSAFASGKAASVAVDAGHVVLDVAVATAIIGAMIHFPPLALIPKVVALTAGFAGDIVAGAVHGVGALGSLSDPDNGSTFMDRLKHFVKTQSGIAMIRRVFTGDEPEDDNAKLKTG